MNKIENVVPVKGIPKNSIDLNNCTLHWFNVMNAAGVEFNVDGDSHTITVANETDKSIINCPQNEDGEVISSLMMDFVAHCGPSPVKSTLKETLIARFDSLRKRDRIG